MTIQPNTASRAFTLVSAFVQTGYAFVENYPKTFGVAGALSVGAATRILPNNPQEKIGDVVSAAFGWITSIGLDGVIAFGNRVIIPAIHTGIDKSINFAATIAMDPTKISKPIYGQGAPKNMVGLDVFIYQTLSAHPYMTFTGSLLGTGALSYIAYDKLKDNEKVNNAIDKAVKTFNSYLD